MSKSGCLCAQQHGTASAAPAVVHFYRHAVICYAVGAGFLLQCSAEACDLYSWQSTDMVLTCRLLNGGVMYQCYRCWLSLLGLLLQLIRGEEKVMQLPSGCTS